MVPYLLLTACAHNSAATPVATPTATGSSSVVIEAIPTETPAPGIGQIEVPTDTQGPDQTQAAVLPDKVCDGITDVIDAALVQDINLTDGARLAPNTRFMKIWLVRNTGTCNWPAGTELVRIAGDTLSGPDRVPVTTVGPSREVELSIELKTPVLPDHVESLWRLRTPEGRLFGAVLFVDVAVEEGAPALALRLPAAPVPGVWPTGTATPVPTATPRPTLRPTAVPTLEPTATARPTQAPTPAPTSTVPPTSVPTSTPAPTATPLPTATPPPPDGPTATPVSASAYACDIVDSRFTPVVTQATGLGIPVTCATGATKSYSGQVQAFRQNVEQGDPHLRFRSFMILRHDTGKVYVLDGKDANAYEATPTTYTGPEGIPSDQVPATCAALTVPEGYMLPMGPIGAVWCNHSLWISVAGWPSEPAAFATLDIQETTNGLLIRSVTAGGEETLFAIDFDSRRATVY